MSEYILFWRTLRSSTWCYGGTYKSVEAAKRKVKKELGKAPYQYKVEKRSGEIVAIDSAYF